MERGRQMGKAHVKRPECLLNPWMESPPVASASADRRAMVNAQTTLQRFEGASRL